MILATIFELVLNKNFFNYNKLLIICFLDLKDFTSKSFIFD
jgi:hypothetical protein